MKTTLKSLRILLLVSFCSASAAPPAGAAPEAPKWEFAGWYGGGSFPTLVPDPNVYGRAYLVSDVAGIWRSDNRGSFWSFRTQGLTSLNIATLTIAKSDSNIVYAGGKAGLFRSDDAGSTWRYLPASKDRVVFKRPDDYRSIAVDRADPNKLYAGTKNGEVYRSADGGATFERLGEDRYPFGSATPISVVHVTRDGRFLFAGSPLGLVRYDLSRNLWEKTGLGPVQALDLQSYLWQETLFVTSGKKVAWSSDFGLTWQYSQALPLASPSAHINRISVRSDRTGKIMIAAAWRDGWGGGVYLSREFGKDWVDIEKNLTHDTLSDPSRVWAQGFGWPLSVSFDPFEPNTLYFTDFWGVWRSDDNGFSWTERIKGAANTVGSDIAVTLDGSVLVATMDNGLLKSSDAGVSYRSLCPLTPFDGSVKGHIWRVLPLGPDGTRLIATNSPWDPTGNQVLISEDGGLTFRKSRAGLPAAYPVSNTVWERGYARALAADPTDPTRLYLGIDGDDGGGFFSSTDGGTTWKRSPGQPGSLRIYNALAVDPTEPARIYWGTAGTSANGGIYRSQDFGRSWQKVFSATGWVFDLTVTKDGTAYAATDAAGPCLYVSRDKGATWELLKKFAGAGACEGIAVDPRDVRHLAVSAMQWDGGAGGKIFLTDDGGANWTDVTANLPNGAGAAAMAFSPDGHFLYLARYAGSVYRLRLA
ncbi:MAG TPA: hypothetical protein VL404_08650 [Candidatus Eisenbacteria bacterium]|nr:hypothetical protein [Candidatus Eisenbacteria bacterium]